MERAVLGHVMDSARTTLADRNAVHGKWTRRSKPGSPWRRKQMTSTSQAGQQEGVHLPPYAWIQWIEALPVRQMRAGAPTGALSSSTRYLQCERIDARHERRNGRRVPPPTRNQTPGWAFRLGPGAGPGLRRAGDVGGWRRRRGTRDQSFEINPRGDCEGEHRPTQDQRCLPASMEVNAAACAGGGGRFRPRARAGGRALAMVWGSPWAIPPRGAAPARRLRLHRDGRCLVGRRRCRAAATEGAARPLTGIGR